MVSFTCSRCQDVVKKPKIVGHAAMCGTHIFTCVDCMKEFTLETIKQHTTCITEVDKYQGQWLKKRQEPGGVGRGVRPRIHGDEDDDGDGNDQGVASLRRKVKRDISDTDSDSDGDWVRQKKRSACARPSITGTKDKVQPAGVTVAPPTAPATGAAETDTARGEAAKANGVAECTVPSFVLGSVTEVAEIVEDIVQGDGSGGWGEKAVAQELVRRYNKRIAKAVREVLQTLFTHGRLQRDSGGDIVSVTRRQ